MASDQCRGCGPSGLRIGFQRFTGAHHGGDVLQRGGRALPPLSEPRGPGPDQALPVGPAHRGVPAALPGLPQRQSAGGRGEAVDGGAGKGAASRPAAEKKPGCQDIKGGTEAEEEDHSLSASHVQRRDRCQLPQGLYSPMVECECVCISILIVAVASPQGQALFHPGLTIH